jgi:uncharacterized membrane protein
VPSWLPIDKNVVVVASGVVELCLAVALLATWRQPARGIVGAVTAGFFVAILPGNIAQFAEHSDGFGLDTDAARAIRLLLQPLLVLWALAVTSAVPTLRSLHRHAPDRRSRRRPGYQATTVAAGRRSSRRRATSSSSSTS